jgi:hypothetical protein
MEDEADKATIGYLSESDIAEDQEMPSRASQQKRASEIKEEKKKKIKLEDKIKQEIKIKQEGQASSSSTPLVPVAPDDNELETLAVNFNNNTDIAFWEASSPNEIRSQLNLRFPEKRGDWVFKNKAQLVSIIRGLIRKKQWVKGESAPASAPASSSSMPSAPSNTPALDPNDDDLKVGDVTWDTSQDLDYWSQQSASYIRSNLARRFPAVKDRMKYSFFTERQEYIDYISNLIKQGKW